MSRKPTIPEVLPLFVLYVQKERMWYGWTGPLHAVLDDGNVSDWDVRAAYETCVAEGDHAQASLARLLMAMSRTQRLKLGAMNMGEMVPSMDALVRRLLRWDPPRPPPGAMDGAEVSTDGPPSNGEAVLMRDGD